MAQPSSSHRDREHHDRRERSSSHRTHRSISSTTLLLVLSLILAVLAVMLSLPNAQSTSAAAATGDAAGPGVWKLLAPKRSEALVSRESAVAAREAEVARREAELLAGAPGGVVQPPVVCPACPSIAVSETTVTAPVQTVIKEVVKEVDALTPPGWWREAGIRAEDILAREQKIAEREKEISRREEAVNRREHDASRRESWIMEQLVALGNEPNVVEEEYVYEQPAGGKRKAKGLPPLILTATQTVTEHFTHTISTATVTLPSPANTRFAPSPAPQKVEQPSTASSPRTTAIEVVVEEEPVGYDDDLKTVTVVRSGKPPGRRPPGRWWGGW